jgi:hypothetical protein
MQQRVRDIEMIVSELQHHPIDHAERILPRQALAPFARTGTISMTDDDFRLIVQCDYTDWPKEWRDYNNDWLKRLDAAAKDTDIAQVFTDAAERERAGTPGYMMLIQDLLDFDMRLFVEECFFFIDAKGIESSRMIVCVCRTE